MDYTTVIDTSTESSAVFYGLMGAASALILSNIGAAYGSAKANIFHSPSSPVDKQAGSWENIQENAFNLTQNSQELFHSFLLLLLVYWPSMV